MLPVVRTAHDFRRACQEARLDGPLALVPTMGYLHEGHTSLIRAARQAAPTVAVTIFVNPAQFGPTEDLARYPRDLEGDLRMAQDLNLGTDVVGRPIVREKDGLARSSRNAYLSPEERQRALGLWRALSEARARFGAGERDVAALESLAAEVLDRHGLRADYAELRDPIELQRPVQADESTRLLLAAFVGKTRLIDNGALREGG